MGVTDFYVGYFVLTNADADLAVRYSATTKDTVSGQCGLFAPEKGLPTPQPQFPFDCRFRSSEIHF
jgi:hypothetical protein